MAAADWLARKLMAEGYKVWRDGLKLFGGERFESVIDNAIKTKTFRVLGLLSKHSIKKENPSKERALAMDLGKYWGIEDFLIPLNLDGLTNRQLSWAQYGIQYIPFQNWADGFQKLLKRLEESQAPKSIPVEQGRALAAETFLPRGILVRKTETLYTNCLRFEHIPQTLQAFKLTANITPAELESLALEWPFYTLEGEHVIAFGPPPAAVPETVYEAIDDPVIWMEENTVERVPSRNVVSNLLWQSFRRTLLARGLRCDASTHMIYFPPGLLPKDKIWYLNRRGRRVPVLVVNDRKFGRGRYRYHLAPEFRIRQDFGEDFIAQVKIRVFLTDMAGKPFNAAQALPRRKNLCQNWFNHHWLSRVLAVCSFLADGAETVRLGDGDDAPILAPAPICGTVTTSLDETRLAELRKKIPAHLTGWDDDEELNTEEDA
jgi:hypothetical protein